MHNCPLNQAAFEDSAQKPTSVNRFIATCLVVNIYVILIDIDSAPRSDIIRWHLAIRATSEEMVKSADYDVPYNCGNQSYLRVLRMSGVRG